ncbi:hypothetical protein DES38_104233 [Streptohalobacillus salinus]|uniref:Uncharacterized protein n=1 Tax=Streptohalobacillus salinus TaxID=621096 RepID=A0A2V3WF87_9BACI|nr:hypothetical protein [Streptohalobacillus salinus]PXW91798.1 hypothetical protein DES38_104233 [Streptohalobacillus salinus]
MKKPDESEKSAYQKAAVIAFSFYATALFVIAVANYLSNKRLGLIFTVFIIGQLLFLVWRSSRKIKLKNSDSLTSPLSK